MVSIKKNFLYNILLQISKVLFPLITAPYIARVLDPDGVGIVNFVNTYTSYFTLFALLGIPTYAIREIAKHRHSKDELSIFVSQVLWIEILTTLIITLIFITSVYLIPMLRKDAILFIISGIALYLTPFNIEWYFSGMEEFGYITKRALVIRTISVIALFIFVRDRSDLIAYITIGAVSTILNYLWNWKQIFNSGMKIKISSRGAKKHLKPVLILFGASIAISIYGMLDTLMLGFQSSYNQVGYYNSAIHLIKTILPLATALSSVAVPRMAIFAKEGNYTQANELINKSIGVVSFLAFPMAVGIIMIAPIFVPLFFGNQFYSSILPMQIGALLIISVGLNNLNGVQILIGLGRDKEFLFSVASGALTNFLLNFFLIPKFGASGAAIASVVAETQIFLVNQYFVRKYTLIRLGSLSSAWKAGIGAACIIPICIFLSKILTDWGFVCCASLAGGLVYIIVEKISGNSAYRILENIILSKLNVRR